MDADKNKFIIEARIVLATDLSVTPTKYSVNQLEPADFTLGKKFFLFPTGPRAYRLRGSALLCPRLSLHACVFL